MQEDLVSISISCFKHPIVYDDYLFSVDGGVSRNDFLCQLLADLTGIPVERSAHADIGILGVAFVTGLSSGKSPNIIRKISENLMIPNSTRTSLQKISLRA